jgi:hypothetical protein
VQVKAAPRVATLTEQDQPRRRRIAFTVGDWRVVYRVGGAQPSIQSGVLAGSPMFDSITGTTWVRVLADGDAPAESVWTCLDDIVDVL